MITLQREVQSCRVDNEKIMKAWEEILQSLNMLHKQANKDFNANQEANARQMTTSKSHSRRDYHGNDMQSRSTSRPHHSPRKSTRRAHASSRPRSNPMCLLSEDIEEGLRETSCKVKSGISSHQHSMESI
jgi:hypothetical protein